MSENSLLNKFNPKGGKLDHSEPDPHLDNHYACIHDLDSSNPRLRIITANDIQENQPRIWQDVRLFFGNKFRSSRKNISTITAVNEEGVEPAESSSAPTSQAARRLSLVVDEIATRGSLSASPRRLSLTPLAYCDPSDFVEQFIEPEQVMLTDPTENTADESTPMAELQRINSAEHFNIPRNSIAGGIKIEITPPSAIRDNKNFILDSVVVEVPEDDESVVPADHSRVFMVQQLSNSTTDLPEILANIPSLSQTNQVTVSPDTSIQEITSPEAAPPARRRTKLLAIKVGKQTLSAISKPFKTVRFSLSPTRKTQMVIDEDEADRSPYIWDRVHASEFETPEQMEQESEEPLEPGLLKGYDFSGKELRQVASGGFKFIDERNEITRFFGTKLADHARRTLPASTQSPVPETSSIKTEHPETFPGETT